MCCSQLVRVSKMISNHKIRLRAAEVFTESILRRLRFVEKAAAGSINGLFSHSELTQY